MQSICSFLTAAKRRKGAGNKFPAGVWGLESRARCAGFSVTEIGNRRERLRDHASFPDQSPITPPSMDCIAIHLSPFFKPPRSEDGSLRDNRPSGGVWGGSPIVPPVPPSLDAYLSPFHHRRTRSARKRIKLPVRHVLDSVVRLYRTRRRRSRRRYAVAMRHRHVPA